MNIGIVVGKFYPLHMGHVNMIQQASAQFDKTIVIVSHHGIKDLELYKDSNLKRPLTGKDKLAIVQKTFQYQKELIIPILVDETECPQYPDGWWDWSGLVKSEILSNRRVQKEIGWTPNWAGFIRDNNVKIVINETQDETGYLKYFGTRCEIFDFNRTEFNISATMVRNDPFKYWDFIPRASREFLVPTIVIAGGESSGKSIMTNKMANIYATTSVEEYGRTITDLELGGDESALQYKHYRDIVNGHYQDLKFAKINANKVVFSDTDFVATQVFCETYEGKSHPVVQEYIDDIRFDLVILLDNSTKWVDDGMRMIGESDARVKFQQDLKKKYRENSIEYVEIKTSDYLLRYEAVKVVVDIFLKRKVSIPELQSIVDKFVEESEKVAE